MRKLLKQLFYARCTGIKNRNKIFSIEHKRLARYDFVPKSSIKMRSKQLKKNLNCNTAVTKF